MGGLLSICRVGPPAAAPRAASTRTAAAGVVRMGVFLREFGTHVRPDRFQHYVHRTFDTEPRPQRRHIDLMRTKVVENRRTAIEKRLDIDELPGPIPLLEYSLTERKAAGTGGQGAPRTR